MSKQATQDDDLIILNDSINIDNEFNFDLNIDTKKENDSYLIDFSIDWLDQKQTEVKDESSNFNSIGSLDFSFSNIWENTNNNEIIFDEKTKNLTEKNDESDFDFLDANLVTKDNVTETSITNDNIQIKEKLNNNEVVSFNQPTENNLWSRNDILDETINKLEKRKTVIWEIRSDKKTNLTDLEAQIKKLQAEVKDIKWEISELDTEEEWINVDIDTINEMKNKKNKKTK